jgi:hypothetical protein
MLIAFEKFIRVLSHLRPRKARVVVLGAWWSEKPPAHPPVRIDDRLHVDGIIGLTVKVILPVLLWFTEKGNAGPVDAA